MTPEDVPQEWVEAGARAIDPMAWDEDPWDNLYGVREQRQQSARRDALSALAAVIPQVKAAALREAADEINEWAWTGRSMGGGNKQVARQWLRARADRIEAE